VIRTQPKIISTLLSNFKKKKKWEIFSNYVAFSQYPNLAYLDLFLLHCGPGIDIQHFVTDIFTPSGLKRPLHSL
jgi:hypothetical protein